MTERKEPAGKRLPPASAVADPLDLEGRVIAESARVYEAGLGEPLDDTQATAAGRAASGDLEHKLVARARALAISEAVAATLGQVRTLLRLTVLIGLVLAGVAGAVTALTALEAPAGQAVNFHWALLSLLGVETLVLLLWLALTLVRPRAASGPSFGLLLSSLGRWLAGRLTESGDSPRGAALQAAGILTGRGAVARWSLSAISHAVWLAFLAGALAMSLILLSTKQVSFVWQTTILTEASYLPATEAMTVLPRLVGFAVPSRAEIEASRWRGPQDLPTAASGAWAGLLVGSLLLYGLLPRAILLALCLLLWLRAAKAVRLDLSRPEYQRLRERLVPSVRHEGIIGRDAVVPGGADVLLGSDDAPVPVIAFDGPVAILRLEIEAPAEGWPPSLELSGRRAWRDLGAVDGREDRARILAACGSSPPGLVLVAVSLLTTPDRGIGAFLRQLRDATAAPVALLLSDGAHLRTRLSADEARQRLADWRRLTANAGIAADRAILFDLARQDSAERGRLATLLGGETR